MMKIFSLSRPKFSTRQHLMAYFAFPSVVATILGVLILNYGIPGTPFIGTQASLENEAIAKISLVADLKKERIELWLAERVSNVDELADSTTHRELFGKLVDAKNADIGELNDDSSDLQVLIDQIVPRLDSYVRSYKTIDDVAIVDVSSDLLVTASQLTEPARYSSELQISDPNIYPAGSDPGIQIIRYQKSEPEPHDHIEIVISTSLVPLSDGLPIYDSNVLAAIYIDFDQVIIPVLHTGEGLGVTGEALLVNSNVATLNPLKHNLQDGSIAEPLQHVITAQPASLGATGNEGVITSLDYRGADVLAVYRYISVDASSGWGLVVKQDLAEVFATKNELSAIATALGSIALFAIGVVIVYASGVITRPLNRLTVMADGLAAGVKPETLVQSGTREVDTLGNAFSEMATTITSREEELKDIGTELLRSNAELEALNIRIRDVLDLRSAALDAAGDMVLITDTEGTVVYTNPAFTQITGYEASEMKGLKPSVLKSGRQDDHYYEQLWTTIKSGGTWSGRLINRRKNGSEYHDEMTVTPVLSESGDTTHFIAIKRDVSAQVRSDEEVRRLATTDELTGLSNRHQFNVILDQIRRMTIRDKSESTLVIVDIDNFKYVNDTYGHLAGDRVLAEFAERIRNSVRQSDVVARVGGDEFALILVDTPSAEGLRLAIQLIERVGTDPFHVNGDDVLIGLSAGASSLNIDTVDSQDAMASADIALYRAKEDGRGKAVLFENHSGHREEISNAQKISNVLRAGLADDKLILYAQPINPLRKDLPRIREILSRLIGPDGEMYQPGQFIPQAESLDLIDELDRQVVKKTFEYIADHPDDTTIYSLNLSGKSVSPENADWIIDQANRNGINPSKVILELTESALVRRVDSMTKFFQDLKAHGFNLAMDDFGSGVTTFHHLKTIEFDYLKLDGTIIENAGHNEKDRELIVGLAGLAKTLNLQTIAEYVQDIETVEFLAKIGVEYAQGYFVGKPEPLN
jgi:diguanylate cyclase (GGDEF)-like protein/PAS domain S-box-containing protein